MTWMRFPARAGLRRDPEHALGGVLVAGFEQLLGRFTGQTLGREFRAEAAAALLERVLNVLEEDQAQDDVLVLAGVHRAAE